MTYYSKPYLYEHLATEAIIMGKLNTRRSGRNYVHYLELYKYCSQLTLNQTYLNTKLTLLVL